MRPLDIVMAGADDGTGGGAGAGSVDDKSGVKPDPALAEVQAQVGVLTKAVTLMAQSQQETQTLLKDLPTMLKESHPDSGKESPSSKTDLFDGVDLEQLNRQEYGTLLLTKFMDQLSTHLDDKLKPVTEKMSSIEEVMNRDLGSRQVKDVAGSNKDLYEWKDEIAILMKETPGLALARALTIARSENAEKNAAMQKKYASVSDSKDSTRFLSMTPTSRIGSGDEKSGRMKFQEAADKAFDDVVASFGGTSFNQLMGSGR